MSRFFVAFFIALITFKTPYSAFADCKSLFAKDLKKLQKEFSQAELEEQFLRLIDELNEVPDLLKSADTSATYRKLQSLLNFKVYMMNRVFHESFQYSVMNEEGPISRSQLSDMLEGLDIKSADVDVLFATIKAQRESQKDVGVEKRNVIGFGNRQSYEILNGTRSVIGFGERSSVESVLVSEKLSIGFGSQKTRLESAPSRKPGNLEFVFERAADGKIAVVRIVDKESGRTRVISSEILSQKVLAAESEVFKIEFNPHGLEFVVVRENLLNPEGRIGFSSN